MNAKYNITIIFLFTKSIYKTNLGSLYEIETDISEFTSSWWPSWIFVFSKSCPPVTVWHSSDLDSAAQNPIGNIEKINLLS